MNNHTTGFYRSVTYEHRRDVERRLAVAFDDLFDAIESIETNARELEKDLHDALYGTDIAFTIGTRFRSQLGV